MKNTTIILLGNQDIQSSLGFKVLYTLPDSNKKNDNILFSESFEASSYLRLLNEKVDSEFILLQVKPGKSYYRSKPS
jgi:hypothetical protein